MDEKKCIPEAVDMIKPCEPIYKCEYCDTSDCEFWVNFNEVQAEMDESLLWGI